MYVSLRNTPSKGTQSSVTATGHVRFLHASRAWGKVSLNTANQWGEKDVWFHADKFQGRPMLGDNVNIEYVYSRARGLRALSVVPINATTATGSSDWRARKFGTNRGDFTSFKNNRKKRGDPANKGRRVDFSSFKKNHKGRDDSTAKTRRQWRTPPRQNPDRASNRASNNSKTIKSKKVKAINTSATKKVPEPKHSPSNIRVARGPAPNGHRGFRFRRSMSPDKNLSS